MLQNTTYMALFFYLFFQACVAMADSTPIKYDGYVYKIDEGSLIDTPSFKALPAATTNEPNTIIAYAVLIGSDDKSPIDGNRFKQQCFIFPAKSFITFASNKAKSAGKESPDFVWMYRFMSEKKNFVPETMLLCSTSEVDTPLWQRLINTSVFKQGVTRDGVTYAYALNKHGAYFFY